MEVKTDQNVERKICLFLPEAPEPHVLIFFLFFLFEIQYQAHLDHSVCGFHTIPESLINTNVSTAEQPPPLSLNCCCKSGCHCICNGFMSKRGD